MGEAFLRHRNANSGGLVLFDNGARVAWETGGDAGYATIDTSLNCIGDYNPYGSPLGGYCGTAVAVKTGRYSKLRYTVSEGSGNLWTHSLSFGSAQFMNDAYNTDISYTPGTYEIDISAISADTYISFSAGGTSYDGEIYRGSYKISKVELVR